MVNDNYREQIDFLSNQFEEIQGTEFYSYIFPNNEMVGEDNIDYSKPNAIYLYSDISVDSNRRMRRRIMLTDSWDDDFINYVEENDCSFCSGLAYRGKKNHLAKAQTMNALVFDLDGVGLKELRNLFLRFGKDPSKFRTLPEPTFIVSSGTGIHLYYVFDKPIDLFPNIKFQLKSLKYQLTFRIWEYKSTSQNKAIQYQSINQGFRMVGSINSKYDLSIRAFKVGSKVSLDYLNSYVREEFQVDVNKPFRPTQINRQEAKENYPEWYQRVVVEKNKNIKKWDIQSKQGFALYEWWKNQIDQIIGGHRYFFLMTMAIYATKCDVPFEKLKKDMFHIFGSLKEVEHDNPLTKYDIESALEAYDKAYYNFTITDIERLTGVRIERNKRNYRTQKEHLARARAVQKIDYPNYEWVYKNGRPSKEQLVREYVSNNLDAKPSQIARKLGISRTTVYKYL